MATIVPLAISEIDAALRPASLCRAGQDAEAIAEYATVLDSLPPVKAFWDKAAKTHWLADGCHTVKAAQSLSREWIKAELAEGSLEGAWRKGSRANQSHGQRDLNADKRARVENALKEFTD